MNKIRAFLAPAVVAALMTAHQAHATLDPAVSTAVGDAKTDLLALIAALTTAGVAIWVGRLIYNKFRVK